MLKEFHKYDFINDIIIFCFEKNNYLGLQKEYNKIRLISNNFKEIRDYLKNIKHAKDDLNMDNHQIVSPMITYFDYKK